MACLRISQTIAQACRNSTPGIVTAWLANYSDVLSYSTNVAGDSITGMTCSGVTSGQKCFYKIAQNKYVMSLQDGSTVNIQNGVAISKPQIVGFVQGMDADVRQLYAELMQATVVAVVKTVDLKYYIVGIGNGLDMTQGGFGTEAAADGKKGFSFTLEGLESKPFYLFADAFAATFESTFVV